MKRIHIIGGIILAAVMSIGGVAEAQGPRAGGRGAGGKGLGRGLPLASLNLTQAQQDLIRDIRERQREELNQIEAKLRNARAAQQQALDVIPADEAAIRQTTLALADVQAEAAVHQARVRGEIFAALTPEQQEAVKNAQAERDRRLEARRSQVRERRQNRQ